MPRQLDTLAPGQRFQTEVTKRRGVVVKVTPSSVTVAWDGPRKKVRGTTRWGEEFVFDKDGTKTEIISRGTMVQRLVVRQ